MDKISSEEIVSILAMHGRPDLIQEFKEHIKIDEDYKPPHSGRAKKEPLSEYEVAVDDNGFQSLK